MNEAALPILIAVVLVAMIVIAITAVLVVRARRRAGEPGAVAAAPTVARGLRGRLSRTRAALSTRLAGLFERGTFDESFWVDLEETLIAADVGVVPATRVVERVRAARPADGAEARDVLRRELVELFAGRPRDLVRKSDPSVILVVGVNGTGKTTSIAKLAARLQADGSRVLLGSADTFRAAADRQLRTWAERVGVEVVGGESGTDPASVAYDAVHRARDQRMDVVIVDTAGRLQTKTNLMDELAKVARVLRREAGEIDEVLLVLDGTTGQNAITQARSFLEAIGITGIVLTKLDGTARGGIAVAVEEELEVPVKFIGVGEAVEDLIPFRPDEFVDALVGA